MRVFLEATHGTFFHYTAGRERWYGWYSVGPLQLAVRGGVRAGVGGGTCPLQLACSEGGVCVYSVCGDDGAWWPLQLTEGGACPLQLAVRVVVAITAGSESTERWWCMW